MIDVLISCLLLRPIRISQHMPANLRQIAHICISNYNIGPTALATVLSITARYLRQSLALPHIIGHLI